MCRAGSRIRWDDDVVWPVCWEDAALLEAWNALRELFGLARELGLLFDRSSWLMGWRSGVPGAQMNSLRAALRAALALEPVNGRLAVWRRLVPSFAARFGIFVQGARSWLLARRLRILWLILCRACCPRLFWQIRKTCCSDRPCPAAACAESCRTRWKTCCLFKALFKFTVDREKYAPLTGRRRPRLRRSGICSTLFHDRALPFGAWN